MESSFIIGSRAVSRDQTFQAYAPAAGENVGPDFAASTVEDVAEACRLADEAFDSFRELDPEERARFLETVASKIEAVGEELVERAMLESGLPRARLEGERGRTTGQLRLFARVLREGRWAGVTLDAPLPERKPMARADLRQRRIAVGPVAVFGASNFPLAFSVGGGDTASAFAAGCPVVVKAHSAHPGTSLIVGHAIRAAIAECGLHEGVFSLVHGPDRAIGTSLVADPRIKAVGFTGSRAGGMAFVGIANSRPEPIPVYAEMSSINPVILMPNALAARAEALGQAYVGSLTLGAGQFCTNPGVVLGVKGSDLDTFASSAAATLANAQPQVMLTSGIHGAYEKGVADLSNHPAIEEVGRGVEGTSCNAGRAAIFAADAKDFLANPELAEEVFGAASLVVRCDSLQQVAEVVGSMEGQLTATIHLDEADHDAARPLLPLLERKAGRILANGWPTGVEVSYAMVHGGPFPATSDPRATSVGAAAIERFLRPVCYQDIPEALLPKAVKSDNPLDLPRFVNAN